jgi:hypothetical protein
MPTITFTTQIANLALSIAAGTIGLLMLVYVLRNTVWAARYPFLFINWLMWTLYNPLRDAWTDPHNKSAFRQFCLLFYSGLGPLVWLAVHLVLTPLRIVNAIYFDIVLYWSVVFCDSINELLHPRLKYRKNTKKCNYLCRWIVLFPLRLIRIFQRNGFALLEGIVMSGVDIVFPTFTMYHGTSFKGIATNIAQQGRWFVGSGDYAGSGIYFGFFRKTAEHYAKGEDHAIICARVTLFPCRNSATLPSCLRKKIGCDGSRISRDLPFPFRSIEHWRNHSYAQWFEYCLVQPGKEGRYIRTWRARPICVLHNSLPKRIWGGLSLWTGGAGGLGAILFSWGTIFLIIYLYQYYLSALL